MTTAGWIFMIISWTTIIALFLLCYARTLKQGNGPAGGNEESSSQ